MTKLTKSYTLFQQSNLKKSITVGFQGQNRISLFNKHLRLLHSHTDSLGSYRYSCENLFSLQDLGFFSLLPDTPFVGRVT